MLPKNIQFSRFLNVIIFGKFVKQIMADLETGTTNPTDAESEMETPLVAGGNNSTHDKKSQNDSNKETQKFFEELRMEMKRTPLPRDLGKFNGNRDDGYNAEFRNLSNGQCCCKSCCDCCQFRCGAITLLSINFAFGVLYVYKYI